MLVDTLLPAKVLITRARKHSKTFANSTRRAGEQKSGTTWLWEMLNGHPCLLTAAQPYLRMGAITTKETYYFTSTKLVKDAREFLVPWLGFRDQSFASSDAAWQGINGTFLEQALKVADRGTTTSAEDYYRHRNYSSPGKKLRMTRKCERYFLLEGARASASASCCHGTLGEAILQRCDAPFMLTLTGVLRGCRLYNGTRACMQLTARERSSILTFALGPLPHMASAHVLDSSCF